MDHMESSFSAINRETIEALYHNEGMVSNNQSSRNKSCGDELVGDLKVCNICGNAGHKGSLAVCSNCIDGAEHTYCMRVSMDILPDSSWMCEECVDSEEKVKLKSANTVPSVTYERQEPIIRPNRGGEISKLKKVCNICGAAGKEDSLAVCSKCKDGAEHIYCMRVSMDQLPDNSWMCEECEVSEEKVKLKSARVLHYVTSKMPKSINQPNRAGEVSKGLGQKMCTQIKISRGENASDITSADSMSSNQIPTLMRKRTKRELKLGLSSISGDYGASYLTVKSSHELSSRSRSIQDNEAVPLLSGKSKPKVSWLDEVPQNQFSKKTQSWTKFSTLSSLRQTVPYSDAISGCPTASIPKFQSTEPKPFGIVDFKTSRISKEHNTNETKLERSSIGGGKSRPKIMWLDELPQDHFSKKTQNWTKFSTLSSLRQTVPFSDAISGCPTASIPKFQSTEPKSFGLTDFKTSRISKEHNTNETKLVRSSRGGDNPSLNSQSLAMSSASEEATNKGGRNNDFSVLKPPLSSSNAIQEDESASLMESSSRTEKVPPASTTSYKSTDTQRGTNEYIGRNEETQLEYCSSDHSIELMSNKNPYFSFYKELPMFAFPECEYTWRGEFNIQQSERLPNVLYRIQAHLSSLGSPRIPEVVKKFSSKISLEEVSRMNAWPNQFQEHDPQDNNIALYFFAQDNMSYGNYRSLVHSMTYHDLTLRGNICGIEVLIFSSRLLPEGSRYWNGQLFLWGVFRCRKVVVSQISV